MNKALFLDRDGVININHGHVGTKEKFHFIEGIFKLVKYANELGYVVVVITNQAGIARGHYTEDDFKLLMDWMKLQFENCECKIDKIYYCPNHPTAGIGIYKKDDHFRKPGSGMFLQAKAELEIDMKNSILVGDKGSDIIAGLRAEVGTNLLYSQNHFPELDSLKYDRIKTLEQAIDYVKG